MSALDDSHAESREPMRTDVEQSGASAVLLTIKRDRSIENGSTERLFTDLLRQSGDVPSVIDETHNQVSSRRDEMSGKERC